jgi:Arm DNA-binding domain
MSLTDTKVKNAKPMDRRYKMADGRGLFLEVRPTGTKTWRMRYQFAGRERKLVLGQYPAVTLAMARDFHINNLRVLAEDVDPAEKKKQAKRAAKEAAANNFEDIAREWFLKFSARWAESHSSKVLLRLENDLFPCLGSRPIGTIEADELLGVLRRIEARGALDSAHRCLGYCSQIYRYAIATARAKRNPAADLRGALPPARGGRIASSRMTPPGQKSP